jgi:hypothetical protein
VPSEHRETLIVGPLPADETLQSERHADGLRHAIYPTATMTLCGRAREGASSRTLPTCVPCHEVAAVYFRIDRSAPHGGSRLRAGPRFPRRSPRPKIARRTRRELQLAHGIDADRTPTTALFDPGPANGNLTDNQTRALAAIEATGWDGLTTDELGQVIHADKHDPREICAFCGSAGRAVAMSRCVRSSLCSSAAVRHRAGISTWCGLLRGCLRRGRLNASTGSPDGYENENRASWTRIDLEGATAFERARDVAEKMPQPGWYEAHGVYLCAIEKPFFRKGQDMIRLVQGCVLAAIPRELHVWEVSPSQWKPALGVPIREKPDATHFPGMEYVSGPNGEAWTQDAFDSLGVAAYARDLNAAAIASALKGAA